MKLNIVAVSLTVLLGSIALAQAQGETDMAEIVLPAEKPVYHLLGEKMTLKCQLDGIQPARITWEKNSNQIDESTKTGFVVYSDVEKAAAAGYSTLEKSKVTAEDKGIYTCVPDGNPSKGWNVQVFVFDNLANPEYSIAQPGDEDIDAKDAVLGQFGDNVQLGCSAKKVGEEKELEGKISWRKDGVDIVEKEDKYSLGDNGTLTVISVLPEDVGEYECVLELGNGNVYNKTVNLFSSAYVVPFDKSKNLVQGDPLVLECKVEGHPTPQITWMKDDRPLDTSEERVKLKANSEGVENGTLRIENLDFDDRADYVCYVENTYGASNSTILVRVKDKLAALWPFLGICAEVAILVVIIFIYERKRAKKLEEMEAKEEADHLTNSHAPKGGDDVRQRK